MDPRTRVVTAATFVSASLVVLFLLPSAYFIAGTFAATSVMIACAFSIGGRSFLGRPTAWAFGAGVISALVLYGVFYGGNLAIKSLAFLGLGGANESSIYSLISSPSNPLALQVAVLLFDALGYEAFFRGVLQGRLSPRLGAWSAPIVALFDATLHIATFNPLWVATTFVADLTWGLTYHYGKGLPASLVSHFLWDIAIFVVRPIV